MDNGTGNRATQWVRWTARIWGGVVFLLAMLVFAGNVWGWVTNGTADPYAVGDYPPIENVPPLLMLVGAVGSAIAWRWEGLGGAMTVVSQLAALPILLIHWPLREGFPRYLAAPYGLWLVVAIPGVLFLACWWRSRGSRCAVTGG